MASYKDSPNLKFSPYVQTLPVEAMAKVGMYKQQRYDQGVQKIQQSIDNIAGLDIVRPEDKQYLQSKLNQLGSQLSSVAGGDFSNFALVNSVNGMTNQIAKDPRVLKDVASSSAYRKALDSRTKLVEQGKGSASNDFIFNEQVNAWMNGGKDASFNSTYRPYSDYESKKREIIKTLTAKVTGKSIIYGSDGRLLDAMTYEEVEEISGQKILTALKQGLSPDEFQQLQIDGRYKYSNVSKEQFVSDVNSRFTEAYDKLATQKKNLYTGMQMLDDPIKQELVQNEINRLSNEMTNVKQQYETTSESFLNGDVESAKARLFANDWFNDSANVYSVKNVKQEYKTNPILAVQLQREGWARADARTKATLEQAANFKDQDNKIEMLKIKLKQNELTAEERSDAERELEKIYITEAKTSLGEVTLSDKEVMQTFKDETDILISNGSNIRDSILEMTANDIEDYDTDNDGKLSDKEKEVKFDKMLEMYNTKSTDLKVPIKEQISAYLNNRELLDLKNRQIEVADKYANTINPVEDVRTSELQRLATEEVDEQITLGSNYHYGQFDEIYTYSQEEMLDKFTEFANNTTKRVNKYAIDFPEKWTPKQREEISEMTNGMDPRLLELWKFSYTTEGYEQGLPARNMRSAINKSVRKIQSVREERQKKYNEAFAKKLKETSFINQGVDIGVNTEDAKSLKRFKNKLNQLVAGLNVGDSGISGSNAKGQEYSELSPDQIITSIQSASSGFVTRNAGGDASVTFITETGETIRLALSDDALNNLFKEQALQTSPQVQQFDKNVLPQMMMNQKSTELKEIVRTDEDGYESVEEVVTQDENDYWTTATDGKYNTSPENSYFKQYKFQNVKRFEVTGNIVSSVNPKLQGNRQIFTLKLNVTNPSTGKQILLDTNFATGYTKGNILKTIAQLSDEVIIDYINKQKKKLQDQKDFNEIIDNYFIEGNNSKQ